ncbi:general substrate transporter [Aspergillus bertholletiae]|uniref:General substrate transporter n=1 Tax=Aspergillus bertholletiae TaxID=1226010 RepID=A0A5N7B0P9_9EURO|nr:general substrate transporter [Aspergillus bertholletiae]
MQPYFGLRGSALNRAIIWLVVCPAFVCYGYNQGVIGGLLTLKAFNTQFPQMNTLTTTGEEQHYNSTIQGTVIALYTVGGIFGSLSCIYLGDMLGRRKVIFIASAVSLIGAVLMATSFQMAQFIVARLVLGLGTGGYVATVPVWQSEISQPKKRGAHVVTDGIFIGAGIALSLWIDFGLFFVKDNSVSWRFPLVFQVLFSVLVMLFITIFPESPRWLAKKGRIEEAREILAALADVDPHAEEINTALANIERSLALAGSGSWKDMLTMGDQRLFHRTVLAATGQMFQQMCGINLITFYATTIFEQYLGVTPLQSRILAASMTLTQPLGGFLAFFTIDRLGRRPLMLWSAAGMAICMAILGGTTSVEDNTGALVAAVVFLFAFEFIFTVGYAGLTFLYATEVAPLQLRAAISAVSTAAVWTFNFLLAEVTPVGFNTIGYKYYIIFAVLNAAIVPTVYFFFPETNGRSLEEIDEIFLRSKSIFDPPRLARTLPKLGFAEPTDAEAGTDSAEGGSDVKVKM